MNDPDRLVLWEKFLCHLITQMARTPVLKAEQEYINNLVFGGLGLDANAKADIFLQSTRNFDSALTKYPLIADLRPSLIKAPKGIFFICSDFPVVATNFAGGQRYVKNNAWCLDSAGFAICYPLNPELTLILADQHVYSMLGSENLRTASIRDVDILNILQLLNCDKVVYCKTPDEEYLKNLLGRSRGMVPRKHWVESIHLTKKGGIERRQHSTTGELLKSLPIRSKPKFFRAEYSEHDLRFGFTSLLAVEWEYKVMSGERNMFDFYDFFRQENHRATPFPNPNLKTYPYIFPPYFFPIHSIRTNMLQ